MTEYVCPVCGEEVRAAPQSDQHGIWMSQSLVEKMHAMRHARVTFSSSPGVFTPESFEMGDD